MSQPAMILLCVGTVLAVLLWPRRQPRYTEERNGSWIAEERRLFDGTLTTWREVTGGSY